MSMDEQRLQRILNEFAEAMQRPSTLSQHEQELIENAIADLRAGRGVRFRQRGELEREFVERETNRYLGRSNPSKPLPRPSFPGEEEYV